MKELKSNRKDDVSNQLPESLHFDASRWLGVWYNALDEPQHIAKFEILQHDSKWYVHAFGACEHEPYDWGLTPISVFNYNIESPQALGFIATYDFGFCETLLAGIEKQNLLTISTYTTYKDGSNRHNYIQREFYVRK